MSIVYYSLHNYDTFFTGKPWINQICVFSLQFVCMMVWTIQVVKVFQLEMSAITGKDGLFWGRTS